jgi:hypothetical protein
LVLVSIDTIQNIFEFGQGLTPLGPPLCSTECQKTAVSLGFFTMNQSRVGRNKEKTAFWRMKIGGQEVLIH